MVITAVTVRPRSEKGCGQQTSLSDLECTVTAVITNGYCTVTVRLLHGYCTVTVCVCTVTVQLLVTVFGPREKEQKKEQGYGEAGEEAGAEEEGE